MVLCSARFAVRNINFRITAWHGCVDGINHPLNMGFYIRPLLLAENDDSNLSALETLLVPHVLIRGHKDIEKRGLGCREKLAVGEAVPPRVFSLDYGVSGKKRNEGRWHAMVT